jgi:phosphohistidine phosphatase
MKLLVVRHAAAADKQEFARTGKSDDLRPLTPAGKREMREVTRGLREIVSGIDILATSPLVRAVQTAEILGDSYKRKLESIESLRPEARYEDFAIWAHEHADKKTVAIVGHEPHLSGLVSWLLASSTRSLLELKKGAACLLEFEDSAGAGAGTLLWSMAPKHLRAVGRRP